MPPRNQKQDFTVVAGHETRGFDQAPASIPIPATRASAQLPLAGLTPIAAPSLPVPSQNAAMTRAKPRRKGGPGPFRRRRMDRMILRHCAQGQTALSGLTTEIAKGTLYRRVTKLLQAGALERCGRTYHTTTVGQHWLAEDEANIDWNVFDQYYPPFADMPTPHHKGLLELLLSAVVVRQAGIHDDHLCAFAAIGRTLRGKTTCGRMACATIGVDPSVSLIDLASEAGRSVFVRRTSQGQLLTERSVLSNPLVVFDDYLQASAAVRAATAPFLSGRRSIPYENGVIVVNCVTLLTLNPYDKPTLEEQTTLNPAQLRRLIVCNFDAVPIPDLSLTGHLALETARTHGPLQLPVLRTDLQEHRGAVVQLIRGVVRPERHDRIDTEMILLLAAGMTGFIDDDERAVQQTVYNLGLMVETLGWARADWVTTVSHFSLHPARSLQIERSPPEPTSTLGTVDTNGIILIRRPIMTQQTSATSPYTLSEEARARLILMAAEERITFTHAGDILTDYYDSSMKSRGMDLEDMHSILSLSKDLKLRELPINHVKVTLAFLAYLRENDLDVDHFESAVHLLHLLHQSGLTAHGPEVTRVLEVACDVVTSGVPAIQVEQWLAERATEKGWCGAGDQDVVKP